VFDLAALVRLVSVCVLAGYVVRDALHPERDAVRDTYEDDPDGGVLDGAPDAINTVALGLEARGLLRTQGRRVDDALRQVGLEGFDRAYPHQLSGGMAQRAALARALVNEPSVMLMDEPLANLDSLTRIAMQTELMALWQREHFTAFLVTHDVEEALFLAERVLVLSERPARVVSDIAVDLPYPRHRGHPRFTALRQEVLGELGLQLSW